jgi:RsiW-degrading membrane proteinase PrsW (M82 family)
MTSESCRVCNRPSTHKLGPYTFCDAHYEKVKRQRSGLWQADLVSVVVLIAFVLLVYGVERWLRPTFTSDTLLLTGIILALVPAIIWLAFFYRRDRLEPEPVKMVIEVFILGGLLANTFGMPLVDHIYRISDWLYRDPPWSNILGGVLVIGFTQEFLKYAAVRFSVYGSTEFDERTDGIIYATAAGLGYATALNIAFVVSSGGVDLGVGSIRIVLTALAHASFAGVMGHFLARQKFESHPLWWMPLGVSLAALLNGIFFYLRGMLAQTGLSAAGGDARMWTGLVLAAILAIAVTWILSRTIRRDLAAALEAEEK